MASSVWLCLLGLSVASFGVFVAMPVFWAATTQRITVLAAAMGIAVINSVGNVGGFIGPYATGWLLTRTHSYVAGTAGYGGCAAGGRGTRAGLLCGSGSGARRRERRFACGGPHHLCRGAASCRRARSRPCPGCRARADELVLGGKALQLDDVDQVLIVAMGKAAVPMYQSGYGAVAPCLAACGHRWPGVYAACGG